MLFVGILVYLAASFAASCASNITPLVFGNTLDVLPAAFGDFNSDALTDVFVISKDQKSVAILLAMEEEPLLQKNDKLSCTFDDMITSVVPGDFDGDVFMDLMITTLVKKENKRAETAVHILWGGVDPDSEPTLNCSQANNPVFRMIGQPLALDYNKDMIIDLFGMDVNKERNFYIFNPNRTNPEIVAMIKPEELTTFDIRRPDSNTFLDLDGDFVPDLLVTTHDYFEIWYGKKDIPDSEKQRFVFREKILFNETKSKHQGQSLFLDLELTGKLDLILPVCLDDSCKKITIAVYLNHTKVKRWELLPMNFVDPKGEVWGFHVPDGKQYQDTITVRGGDFNMDGYPDLLATLESSSKTRTFLLQNVPCEKCENFSRTFKIKWDALSPFTNQTVMGVFYDFYQDGILDVIFVEKQNEKLQVAAFKNSLDYDANFVKVMVLTGLSNSKYPISPGSLGKKKRTYGTNLPGPSISYKTTTQDGEPRNAIAAQLPQSGYFSLNLPFTTFGLGRTPNFIDSLTVGVGGKSREYPQIIPNSQMVIIPNPVNDPSRWKAQLFVTPSKLILLSAIALTATCIVIMLIILGLYWKERREDKIEKLQEAHRFHFDAM